jgi:kumamolisin
MKPIILALCGLFVASAIGSPQHVLPGHVPKAVQRNARLGDLDPARRLNLAIGLPLHNQPQLSALLHDLYDQTSPKNHHYLTPQQFTESFGPKEVEYAKLIAFAESRGLTVSSTHANRMLLKVSGSVDQIEKAFHIRLGLYQHPGRRRTFYAPDTEPSMDSDIPVLHIGGLNDYEIPRRGRERPPTKGVPYTDPLSSAVAAEQPVGQLVL